MSLCLDQQPQTSPTRLQPAGGVRTQFALECRTGPLQGRAIKGLYQPAPRIPAAHLCKGSLWPTNAFVCRLFNRAWCDLTSVWPTDAVWCLSRLASRLANRWRTTTERQVVRVKFITVQWLVLPTAFFLFFFFFSFRPPLFFFFFNGSVPSLITLVLTNYARVVSTAHSFSFSISKQAAIQIAPTPEKMKRKRNSLRGRLCTVW